MSSDDKSRIQKLVDWYRSYIRALLVRTESEKVEEFDRESARLETREKRLDEELAICFLGNSGVGKSTLINALVAGKEILLPAGGVGPLTAQALTVRYSDKPRFEVHYHSPQKLRQLVFALEQIHKKDSSLPPSDGADDSGNELDPEMIEEIRLQLEPPEAESGTSEAVQNEPREQYKKQAQLMVKGNQDRLVDLPYLIDSLRYVGGWKSLWGISPLEEDLPNLERLRTALELARENTPYKLESHIDRKFFQEELKAHASGFLAPLIRNLQVFWDSPLLREGLAIVDLPGIGIAGDVNRDITNEWIRGKARAIVLVVDSRGITQSSADLLYQTGFLNSLLYTSNDPANDPVLVVAVVKVDDIANSRFDEDKTKRRAVHFQEVCAETVQNVKSQLRAQLENNWSQQATGGSEQRGKVLNNVMSTVQIHPVSAIQYRRVLEHDPEEPAFIRTEVESNILHFQTALKEIAKARRRRITTALNESTENFFSQVNAAVNVIHAQWTEENRAQEEAARLRDELIGFITPKQKEFYSRQGGFREFLKHTVPQRIEALVKDASRKAEKDIHRYLQGHQETHWSTLRAAVRRGGTFIGARHIDLPVDFALRFEEPVAEVWATKLLKEIRSTTNIFTEDCVSLVEEVARWAKLQGTRVSAAILEAQREAIKADSKKLTAVGKEMVNELRESVKNSLLKQIESPIRKKCAAFIKRGEDVGTGVKHRMLGLFKELAEDVVAAATEPATKLLLNNFLSVKEQ